jgi:hypothetical protein
MFFSSIFASGEFSSLGNKYIHIERERERERE